MAGRVRRWAGAIGAVGAALAVAACGGGGGGGGGSAPSGTLQLSMTDAPACYEHVMVNVAKVRVHMGDDTGTGDADGGWRDIVPANAPVLVDLVNLTNGQLQELGSATVPAGRYHQMRLVLAATGNTVTPVGGTAQPLKTPSGQQSGLKIKADFEVAADEVNDYLLDFDACKSIVLTGSGMYILKPVVRLSAKPAGAIQGYVSSEVTLDPGTGTPPTPVTGVVGSITVSAQQDGAVVRSTIPAADGKFVLSYLPAGKYTVVITGDGVTSGGTLDTTKGTATRVVAGVQVARSAVQLNTSAAPITLNPSAMGTVTGTITAGTPAAATELADLATVSAMQKVSTYRVEVGATRPDDLLKYSLHLPLAAPELQLFTGSGLQSPTADATQAGKYTIRVWGPGLATKDALAEFGTDPQVVDFAY